MLVPFVIFAVLALVLVLVVVSYSFFIVLMRGMAIFDNNNSWTSKFFFLYFEGIRTILQEIYSSQFEAKYILF